MRLHRMSLVYPYNKESKSRIIQGLDHVDLNIMHAIQPHDTKKLQSNGFGPQNQAILIGVANRNA